MVTSVATTSTPGSVTTGTAPKSISANAADTEDRFLKLLVAQMKNQDPMNPMDNAQVTSQMAQIQTVSSLGSVNNSIQSLATQMTQLQSMQGTNLIGRSVTMEGNRLVMDQGKGRGAFELASAASSVKVEILSPSGMVLDTIQLENQSAGRNSFSWDAGQTPTAAGVSFRVTAANGSQKVSAAPLVQDKVTAINANGAKLELQLQHLGTVAYNTVKTID